MGHGQCGPEIHCGMDIVGQGYIGTGTLWVRDTLGHGHCGQGYIVIWTLWVRDTLGHGHCGSEIHWDMDTVSQE